MRANTSWDPGQVAIWLHWQNMCRTFLECWGLLPVLPARWQCRVVVVIPACRHDVCVPIHSGAGVEFKQQFSGEIIWLPLDGTRNSRGLGIPSTAFLDARTKHPLSCSRCLQTTKPVRDRMSYRREHSVWRGVKGDRGGIIRSSC